MKSRKYAAMMVLGLVVVGMGFFWGPTLLADNPGDVNMQLNKLNYILRAVRDNYVDEPDASKLLEGAIEGMLRELDPHSVYIPADQQAKITEQFRGDFEGIGIQFSIQSDWLTVVSPIPGTPADRLGIRAGDRITHIDGISAYAITNEEVFDKLRGEKGSTVRVTITRPGIEVPLEFEIVRDKIPIFSVGAAFMLPDKETGYVRIMQFTSRTTEEVVESLDSLKAAGMKRLLLDLRGNPGGYLDQAWRVADLFMPRKDMMLVYTKGRTSRSNSEFRSTGIGAQYDMPLVVLINHGSASASEIVSGAIQDHDRGLVVGQVSFGKGLVQTPYPMPDGSVVRITTAKYYTPTGRLIQRPYDQGFAEYVMEGRDDDDPNAPETAVQDTTPREEFKTDGGRTVYGGGGITPDSTVVPSRTNALTAKIFSKRLYFDYASDFVSKHPEWGKDFDRFSSEFKVTDEMLSEFKAKVQSSDIEVDEPRWDQDLHFTKTQLRGEIAGLLFNDRNLYHMIRLQDDEQVQAALGMFDEAKSLASSSSRPERGNKQ
ncbi:MAG: S41 family peptidase [Calditrichaeota bacterium]|nr:S41 family peptidase [Calditrichota bacterium]